MARKLARCAVPALCAAVALAFAPPAAGQAANTWSGTWVNSAPDGSYWVFSQSGQSVGGVWKGSASSGSLSGTIQGSTLSGTFVNNEANQSASFSITLAPDGHSFSGTFTVSGGSPTTWTAGCQGGACTGNAPPPPAGDGLGPTSDPGSPEVTLGGLSAGRHIEIQLQHGAWEPATAGRRLRVGDRIHTGWKAGAVLTFPGGSTMTLKPMTMLSIERLEVDATGKVTAVAFLELGEVKAQINRVRGNPADFQVKTPTSTASDRGTVFGVLYDGGVTIVSVRQGTVRVQGRSAEAVDLPAGLEVAVGSRGLGPILPIGKAGAPTGSFSPSETRALLLRTLARRFASCKLDAYAVVLKPGRRGWRVDIKVVRSRANSIATGRRRSAKWRIVHRRLIAANALARKIGAGCR